MEQVDELLSLTAVDAAELAVLGRCITYPQQCCGEAIVKLVPDDFFDPIRRDLFTAIVELTKSSGDVSLASVGERVLREKQRAPNVVWPVLIDAARMTSGPANQRHYCDVVAQGSRLRRLKVDAKELHDTRYTSLPEAAADVEDIARDLRIEDDARPKSIGQLAAELYIELEDISSGQKQRRLTRTGFRDFDAAIGGLGNGEMWIIAGRPSSGKTAFGLGLAERVARRKEHTVVFELEMSGKELVARYVAKVSRVPVVRLREAKVYDAEWTELAVACRDAEEMPMIVVDKPRISIDELVQTAERIAGAKKIGLVVVDYLQLVRSTIGNSKFQNREQEVAQVSRELKALARTIDCPVVALAQLNRDVDKRSDHKPQLSDLRESGGIEADADGVAFIHREFLYNDSIPPSEAELIVGKTRQGPIGKYKIHFDPETTTFRDVGDDT